jgi:hypothetical protein
VRPDLYLPTRREDPVRKRLTMVVASIAAIGALSGAAAAGNALVVKPKPKTIKCTLQAWNVTYPKLTGMDFGNLTCGGKVGNGVQRDTYNETLTPPNKATAAGTFKQFFNTGTVHGTYSVSGTLTGTSGTFSGTAKVAGGTGAFKNAAGKGTLKCTTNDGGKTITCTSVAKVTGF